MAINKEFIIEVGMFNWVIRTIQRQWYKRVIRRDQFLLLPSGVQCMLPAGSKFATEIFTTNANVDWGSEILFFNLLVKKGALLDVGANIGYYALYMSPMVKNVYCFEPDPRTLKLLEKNTTHASNIHVVSNAVGRNEGKVSFTLENDGELSHISDNTDISLNKIEIDMVTIDSFVNQNNVKVEAIKIDIEGFDVDAIIGAFNTLSHQRPIVLTEAKLTTELFEITKKVNYKIFAFIRNAKNRKKHFAKIDNSLPQNLVTKMLFLLPEEFDEIKLITS